MELGRVDHILSQFPSLSLLIPQGIGEPLLCGDILLVVQSAKARGHDVSFNTNGTLLTAEWAQDLIESGLDVLGVSLDGGSPETYRQVRGRDCFQEVVTNLKQLVEVRDQASATTPDIQIRMVVTNDNLSDIPLLVDLARGLGIGEIAAQDLIDYGGRMQGRLIDRTGHEQLLQYCSEAASQGVRVTLENFSRFSDGGRQCVSPWVSPFVTIDGDVTPCCVITDPSIVSFGNVFETPFAQIWNNDAFVAFRRRLKSAHPPECCGQCPSY
jgi:radical SAM protein with 4Fe4S-binding SPASM domain